MATDLTTTENTLFKLFFNGYCDQAKYFSSTLVLQGHLEYSFLFYGYYGNENIQVGVVKYPLPLAYFVVFLGAYLFSIITVLRA